MSASGRRTTRPFPSRGSGDVERVSRRPLLYVVVVEDARSAPSDGSLSDPGGAAIRFHSTRVNARWVYGARTE